MARSTRFVGYWYGAVAVAGLGFGLLGERRPFGQDLFAHPFVVFFLLVGAGLMALRVVGQRPVPDFISERALALGCGAGIALFLVGNFIAAHLIGR